MTYYQKEISPVQSDVSVDQSQQLFIDYRKVIFQVVGSMHRTPKVSLQK